jgi:hypothetical protein
MPRASRFAGVVWRQLSQTATVSTAKKITEPRMVTNTTWLSSSQAVSKAARISRDMPRTEKRRMTVHMT